VDQVKDHKDLVVWQKAVSLVKSVYKMTALFPANEIYGLTSQLKRAAVSIPVNIAEGAGRGSVKEYAHFTSIAIGSASELETLIIVACELELVKEEKIKDVTVLLKEVLPMLIRLRESLRKKF